MKLKAIICDLDGTLCNIDHRIHHVDGHKKNWSKFFAESFNDKLNYWCLDLILEYHKSGHEILFVTGRHEGLVNSTIGWICTHTTFVPVLNENLFMRGENDFRKDDIIKKELYEEKIEPYYDIILAIDDKKSIINLWKSYNIPTKFCGKDK